MQNVNAPGVSMARTAACDDDFAELFVQHRTAVLRLAFLLVSDLGVAEEITAEVFARVLPKWRSGRVEDPLPYLRRAVINETRSRFRRRANERRALARHASRQIESIHVERAAMDEPLVAALMQLPVRQRAVVVLRFRDDLTETEVAAVLGTSISTVKSHARRGLERLRTLLEETP